MASKIFAYFFPSTQKQHVSRYLFSFFFAENMFLAKGIHFFCIKSDVCSTFMHPSYHKSTPFSKFPYHCTIVIIYPLFYVNLKILLIWMIFGFIAQFLLLWTKYSKHWPYTVAHTFECVCSKINNSWFNPWFSFYFSSLYPAPYIERYMC